MIEVWESQEALERFVEDHLGPAFEAVRMSGRPEPQSWQIHSYMA